MSDLYKDRYFEGLNTIQKLREELSDARNEIDRYEETLEIVDNPEIMKQINLVKEGKIKGIPLKELDIFQEIDE